jgi:2-dehydropantoate 2-reductase
MARLMKVCVLGAGAIGGHIAAKLSHSGHHVSVIARGEHLTTIKKRGIVLQGPMGEIVAQVSASNRPDDFDSQDVVFITVKSNAVGAVVAMLDPLVGPDTLVVFVQNGIPWWYTTGVLPNRPVPDVPLFLVRNEISSRVPADRVIGAVITSGNEVIEPGIILNSSKLNMLKLGHLDNRPSALLKELQTAIARAGIDCPPVSDIRRSVWLKLLRNVSSSPISVITGNNASAIIGDTMLEQVFLRLISETMEIAEAYGYPLTDEVSPREMLQATLNVVPSLLQDFQRHRPMDVAEILLAPLAFASAAGIAVPTLQTVASFVRRLAADRGLYRC